MAIRKRIPDINHIKTQAPLYKKKSKNGITYMQYTKSAILTAMVLAVGYLLYAIYSLECPIMARKDSLPSPPALVGNLEINSLLEKTEILYEHELSGPETIIFHKGHMYTGTGDGRIMDLFEGKLTVLARLGTPPCGTFEQEVNCGRPLGMQIYDDKIYVLDSYLGLFTISLINDKVEHLFNGDIEVDGVRSMFLNSLDISADGFAYITHSSTRWSRNTFMYSVLELEATGRLIKYDIRTNTTTLLLGDLHFANGVLLSDDESYVLVAETTKYRILKYHLKGPKTGHSEIFIDNLVGNPDNIRRSSSGGVWACSSLPRLQGDWSMVNLLAPYPAVRNLIAKIFSISTILKLVPKSASVVYEIDSTGTIVRSLWDTKTGRIKAISEVVEHEGHLYFGSFQSNGIGKLPVPK